MISAPVAQSALIVTWDCGGNLGPRLARSRSQLHGRGHGPSPGHLVRTGRRPHGGPTPGRLPWHARPMGRAPPLPSSRAPRSRRSSARGPRRLPRPPHARAARRRGPARDSPAPPRRAPAPAPSSSSQPSGHPAVWPTSVPPTPNPSRAAPGSHDRGRPWSRRPRARAGHPRELAGRSPAPIAPVEKLYLGAADEALDLFSEHSENPSYTPHDFIRTFWPSHRPRARARPQHADSHMPMVRTCA